MFILTLKKVTVPMEKGLWGWQVFHAAETLWFSWPAVVSGQIDGNVVAAAVVLCEACRRFISKQPPLSIAPTQVMADQDARVEATQSEADADADVNADDGVDNDADADADADGDADTEEDPKSSA